MIASAININIVDYIITNVTDYRQLSATSHVYYTTQVERTVFTVSRRTTHSDMDILIHGIISSV